MNSKFVFRRKLHFLITPLCIISAIFILYQLLIFSQLSQTEKREKTEETETHIIGVHKYKAVLYRRDEENKFVCINSMEKIDFNKINDNYCDCADGSDEPGTNACANGIFFCRTQVPHPIFKNNILSSRVNDGICDCCDGSDEYEVKTLNFRLSEKLQEKLRKYMSPCKNWCPPQDVFIFS